MQPPRQTGPENERIMLQMCVYRYGIERSCVKHKREVRAITVTEAYGAQNAHRGNLPPECGAGDVAHLLEMVFHLRRRITDMRHPRVTFQ